MALKQRNRQAVVPIVFRTAQINSFKKMNAVVPLENQGNELTTYLLNKVDYKGAVYCGGAPTLATAEWLAHTKLVSARHGTSIEIVSAKTQVAQPIKRIIRDSSGNFIDC